MNGREHYVEAERQLTHAEEAKSLNLERNHLLAAQVHATLALSAVRGGEHRIDWEQCGTCEGSGYAPPQPATMTYRG